MGIFIKKEAYRIVPLKISICKMHISIVFLLTLVEDSLSQMPSFNIPSFSLSQTDSLNFPSIYESNSAHLNIYNGDKPLRPKPIPGCAPNCKVSKSFLLKDCEDCECPNYYNTESPPSNLEATLEERCDTKNSVVCSYCLVWSEKK